MILISYLSLALLCSSCFGKKLHFSRGTNQIAQKTISTSQVYDINGHNLLIGLWLNYRYTKLFMLLKLFNADISVEETVFAIIKQL